MRKPGPARQVPSTTASTRNLEAGPFVLPVDAEKMMQTGMPASRLEIGARIVPGGVSFRVWAPHRERVSVVVEEGDERRLDRDDDGYFSGLAAGLRAGARYRYRLDSDE